MTTEPFNYIFSAVRQLLDNDLTLFQRMGLDLFRGFAVILISWFGVKSALSAAQGGSGFHFGRFADLLLMIAFGFGILSFYNNPLPGVGLSFSQMVTHETQYLAAEIGEDQAEQIVKAVNTSEAQMGNPPGVFSFHEELTYFTIYLLLSAVQGVTVMIIAYGVIATGVCMLVGPIFIPFLIVPGFDCKRVTNPGVAQALWQC